MYNPNGWHKNYLTSTNIYLTAKYDKIGRDVSHSKAENPAPTRDHPVCTQRHWKPPHGCRCYFPPPTQNGGH